MSNGKTISIQMEQAFCNVGVKNKAQQLGKLYKVGNVIELLTDFPRYKVRDFESYLEVNNIPYTLYESGNESYPPKVKKYIPGANYSKEIDCYAFTGQEDGDEDGIIAVSELEEVIAKANAETIMDALKELIVKHSFKYDKIA